MLAITRNWRPDLLEEFGVGPIVAATLLCAWSHPHRIHSEAAFEMLADVAPIPVNSGQVTTRYRLNRCSDRKLKNALHTVVQSRIQCQPATRDYVARRTAEGKTGREIQRCLARYVARDPYGLMEKHGHSCLTKHRSVAGCGHTYRRRYGCQAQTSGMNASDERDFGLAVWRALPQED